MPVSTPTFSLHITMLGSGNVATHLSLAFENAGHHIDTVYSRDLAHAQQLAAKLKSATPTQVLDFTTLPVSQIYFLCVTDAALAEVYALATFPAGSLVVHTSGSLPLALLNNKKDIKTGVFYPIQTFSKEQEVDLTQTPIAVEAELPATVDYLKELAASISQQVLSISSQDRKTLHLAAVFACNFTNHLLGISCEILKSKALPPDLLKALVQTTIQKAFRSHPFAVQTGPAIRSDANIIQQQLQQLELQPVYQEIYEVLTHSIQETAFKMAETKSETSRYL